MAAKSGPVISGEPPEIRVIPPDEGALASPMEGVADRVEKAKVRCGVETCNKRISMAMRSVRCECGGLFCGVHRLPELHGCSFDWGSRAREDLTRGATRRHVHEGGEGGGGTAW